MAAVPSSWQEALDLLEHQLTLVDAVLPRAVLPDLDAWTAPTGLGPLPGDLEARARRLHAWQQTVIEELTAAVTGNRQQARLARSVHAATGWSQRPAYLDVTA